jgi:primary-amine oxidase
MTGRDTSKWSVLGWMYNSIFYESTKDLRAALQQPGFQRSPLNLDGDWTVIEDFGNEMRKRDLPAPAMVQPLQARYSLDRKENYVSWSKFLDIL